MRYALALAATLLAAAPFAADAAPGAAAPAAAQLARTAAASAASTQAGEASVILVREGRASGGNRQRRGATP